MDNIENKVNQLPKVLIIEDDKGIIEVINSLKGEPLLEHIFLAEEYKDNAQEIVDKIEKFYPNLICCDGLEGDWFKVYELLSQKNKELAKKFMIISHNVDSIKDTKEYKKYNLPYKKKCQTFSEYISLLNL